MPMDIYSTRAQLAVIDLLPPEYSFLIDTFCANGGVVEDDKAIYDYRKGSRRMAPIVHPGTGGVPMSRDGYETREIGFCTIAPERIITSPDLKPRYFGENVLGAMTPQQREKKMLAQDLVDMRKAIQRRREWILRSVLLTGMLNVFRYTNEGRDLETTMFADYSFTQHYTPATKWSDASAKIDSDMRTMADMVYAGMGYVDVVVMAPDAANAMLENSSYMKKFDGRNIDMGEINTKYRGQGVRFLGWNSDGAEMYSLSGTFIDDDGATKPVLPSGTVLMGAKGMVKMIHGPVTQVETTGANAQHITYIKPEVALRYGSIDGNSIKNRLTSCPTIVPFNVDAWAVAHVL